MSTGADNKTMPVTREYEEGHARVFGERKPGRGRMVCRPGHPRANERGMVYVEDLGDEQPEVGDQRVPLVTDRYMEGTVVAGTGEDIGSRTKRRDYMKRNDLADPADFKGEWAKAAKERAEIHTTAVTGKPVGRDSKKRREDIGRALYDLSNPKKRP